ncbi:H-NS histone family protein [Massilia sp. NEAU-DD11]|uniref:H-NS histone family protein n=1 Tax=Massilia cellulosiltytica TaxID=2683234 RepID=A0A7X3FY23_9BURK|nr:H-NS histone family protein [Telluria cellulosilytica]MVW60028.1 H-NS histone family protein [Telluria cellulosilytica]
MAPIDLNGYDLAELKGLLFDIELEIKRRARDRIHALAAGAGIPLDALVGTAAPRYRNPADSGQTWTGRGRQPRWIAEALASGRSLDDFKI